MLAQRPLDLSAKFTLFKLLQVCRLVASAVEAGPGRSSSRNRTHCDTTRWCITPARDRRLGERVGARMPAGGVRAFCVVNDTSGI